ncbi:hypothetical protein F4824DRAFT_455895 [Ustulina deusta]|nr:hypothetical protein F4824DRAFT_455895 [Ustulina deusta]
MMATLPSLITFGSLTPWPSQDQILQLQREFHRKASLFGPLIEAVRDLDSLWRKMLSQDPALDVVDGRAAARKLEGLLSGTVNEYTRDEKRNALIMPITILAQIAQYLSFLEHSEVAHHHSVLESITAGGGVQGLCAGLLSAHAVASAATTEDVVAVSCTSLRLAFCVGAYVDADQVSNDGNAETTSLAVRWKEPTKLEDIQEVLLNHQNTYIAVTRDERDVTITTPTVTAAMLQQNLSRLGVSFLDIGLSGRYHTSIHADVPLKIIEACQGRLDPRFGSKELVRSNFDGQLIPSHGAVRNVLESILVHHANWYLTISTSAQSLSKTPGHSFVLSIGGDTSTQSITKAHQIVRIKTIISADSFRDLPFKAASCTSKSVNEIYPADAVAVIGMACKFPGADSIDEFWGVLSEGRSMLEEIPTERFDRKNLPRSPRGLRFWGNFVNDIESFDHKFFKKSAREAASMDPQQRLLLQVAYQALESSGYFSDLSKPRDIGCYIGSCSTDYDGNVASHPPTAYSTTGTLRAFLSGRLSHYFGWSGPSLVFDTACSSSAVAIHTACRALQAGEISQAVAGGVTLITSPYLYENLSTAHFLSPSGATKPFDAEADGYCRGEGVGLVVLKRLSEALKDGDNVLGVIAGSAVNQNSNCVSITVPHSPSQSNLYQRVVSQAGINPQEITFVEAHGTGTPVGDPIEMESIREVFGGPGRSAELFVSSVKGNIGHLEAASGVAALIKAILQMEYRTACVQASFKKLNPRIPSLEADRMRIPTANSALPLHPLSACVNNYGAAGSNATLILLESPKKRFQQRKSSWQNKPASLAKLPIQIAAASAASLVQYCELLDDFCQKSSSSLNDIQRAEFLRGVAFSLARQQNQELAHMLTMTTPIDIDQFRMNLKQTYLATDGIKQRPQELPVILCFGGQIRQHVGLSKRVWEQCSLFRLHLDSCDEALRSMGYPGLYPDIFETSPIDDVVVLQSAVFATQYACAQTWLDSGLRVDALVGHSLGQLAALCVSGILSLRDGLKLVAGRASLMKNHWGSEPGTMISVEAEAKVIKDLTSNLTATDSNYTYEVACYNGPSSHVIVSDKASADQLEAELLRHSIRHKRLAVTHGFHSRFTEPMMSPLRTLASSLTLNKAKIRVETCTDGTSWDGNPTPELIAAHTRDPVYFGQAIQRLQDNLGPCTFLEAGSDSSVVSMARRASTQSLSMSSNFVSIDLSKEASFENLADTTAKLWDCGHQVQFWGFNRLQAHEYEVLRLPPYRFEKPQHWLELKTHPKTTELPQQDRAASLPPPPPVLIQFSGTTSGMHSFSVDPRSEEFRALVQGHTVLGNAEFPPSLYVELVSRAVKQLGQTQAGGLISIRDLCLGTPLGLAVDRKIDLKVQRLDDLWNFHVTSIQTSSSGGNDTSGIVVHATGSAALRPSDNSLLNEFARFQRLTNSETFATVVDDPDGTSIKGAMVYNIVSQTVDYADFYRNVKSVASSGMKVTGTVLPQTNIPSQLKDSSVQPHILESFFQVTDLHANYMNGLLGDHTFCLSGVERIQYGPDYQIDGIKTADKLGWNVVCLGSNTNNGDLSYDIYVYDRAFGSLVLLLLGCRYSQVRRTSQREMFMPAGHDLVEPQPAVSIIPQPIQSISPIDSMQRTSGNTSTSIAPCTTAQPTKPEKSRKAIIYDDMCTILENIAELKKGDIKGNMVLEDLGVDSLMMIEVISEISSFYDVELPIEDLEQLTDFNSLVEYLHGLGCGGGDIDTGETSSDNSSPSNGVSTSSSLSTVDTSPILTPSGGPSANHVVEKLSRLTAKVLELEPGDLSLTSVLNEIGLTPQLRTKLAREIQSQLYVDFDEGKLGHAATFGTLLDIVLQSGSSSIPAEAATSLYEHSTGYGLDEDNGRTRREPQQIFEALRFDFDKYAEKTGFKNFWKSVYPDQARLVEAYIIDAFRELDCDITKLSCGQTLPPMNILPRHSLLMSQLRKILAEGGIITLRTDGIYERTAKRIDATSSAILFKQMLAKYPKHASETSLLNVTGSCLSQCLTGKKDPLQLLFANKANRAIMADVYDKAPMCQATTQLLAEFLTQSSSGRAIKILEVGAGTGGTAKYLVEFLTRQGIEFEYTFTDISAALVNQAKKLFAGYKTMKFMALDCDAAPPPELYKRMDVVIATNCIHATKNATSAATNVASLLRDDGVFCLVEFTRGLYWFDLVYGLLDGWWAFSDGRQHALADERFWDQSLRSAGFKHVSWSGPDGSSEEANTMRLICAFVAAPQNSSEEVLPPTMAKRAGFSFETLVWKRVGSLELKADVYYPKTPDEPGKKRPVALMIHGGGHLLFGRQDIPMKHVRVLLQRGFLPVSTDYRLCPELTLFDGPVTDCRESLRWARETLPFIRLSEPSVTVDTSRLLALGWSSGGHLAMTLGHTAKPEGIKPPDVILPFYSPTDLEDEFWYKPNYVDAAEEEPTEIWGELDAVLEEPIVDYTPLSDKRTTALSLTLKDDRARLILHMNWKAQGIPLLIRGLPHKSKVPAGDKTDWKNLPLPPVEKIRECSPYWQILQGNYCTPTFMVHGNNDDWLPHRMTEKTIAELKKRGIPCGIIIPDQCGHAFDLFPRGPRGDPLGLGWAAIENAYNFACDQLRMMS